MPLMGASLLTSDSAAASRPAPPKTCFDCRAAPGRRRDEQGSAALRRADDGVAGRPDADDPHVRRAVEEGALLLAQDEVGVAGE